MRRSLRVVTFGCLAAVGLLAAALPLFGSHQLAAGHNGGSAPSARLTYLCEADGVANWRVTNLSTGSGTFRAVRAGTDIVLWPETVLTGGQEAMFTAPSSPSSPNTVIVQRKKSPGWWEQAGSSAVKAEGNIACPVPTAKLTYQCEANGLARWKVENLFSAPASFRAVRVATGAVLWSDAALGAGATAVFEAPSSTGANTVVVQRATAAQGWDQAGPEAQADEGNTTCTEVAGSLDCAGSPNGGSNVVSAGGQVTPGAELTRGSVPGCVLINFALRTVAGGEAQSVALEKDLVGPATTYTLDVDWQPEPAQNPLPATTIDPDLTGPAPATPMQWCQGTTAAPVLPSGQIWCLVSQQVQLAGSGQVQVTERLFGAGDPNFARPK